MAANIATLITIYATSKRMLKRAMLLIEGDDCLVDDKILLCKYIAGLSLVNQSIKEYSTQILEPSNKKELNYLYNIIKDAVELSGELEAQIQNRNISLDLH